MLRFAISLSICLLLAGSGLRAENGLLAADEAYRQARSGALVLIDIRSPREWEQTGVPQGAVPVTMHDPAGVAAFHRAVLAAVGNDRNRPIAVICAAGNRSRWAQGFLAGKGFTQVGNVGEGMFGSGGRPGWLRRGLPVAPAP